MTCLQISPRRLGVVDRTHSHLHAAVTVCECFPDIATHVPEELPRASLSIYQLQMVRGPHAERTAHALIYSG